MDFQSTAYLTYKDEMVGDDPVLATADFHGVDNNTVVPTGFWNYQYTIRVVSPDTGDASGLRVPRHVERGLRQRPARLTRIEVASQPSEMQLRARKTSVPIEAPWPCSNSSNPRGLRVANGV